MPVINTHGRETDDVPTEWLDAIEEYKDSISDGLKGTIHRRKKIMQIVDKKGRITESDTTYCTVLRDMYGVKTVTETDRFWNPTDDIAKSDDKGGKRIKFGPLAAFSKEHRALYEFRLVAIQEDGSATIAYNPRNPDEFEGDGFQAEVTFDTITGAPLRIVGAPIPLPGRMNEMRMDVVYEALLDGVHVPSHSLTIGMSKLLLYKLRFQVRQQFSEYQRSVLMTPGDMVHSSR